jgi:hypothetical protein
MKVKETFSSFTGLTSVCRFALFINVDESGVEIELDELIFQTKCYNYVVLLGQPFKQKEEVSKLIGRTTKQNDKVQFEINTNGMIKPTGVGNYSNVKYNVHVLLKKSGISFSDRINPTILNWFNDMESNFIFNVDNEDDMDEVHMISNDIVIKKSQMYLSSSNINSLIKWCKRLKYNFVLNLREQLWNKEGRDYD